MRSATESKYFVKPLELKSSEFERVQQLIHEYSGIHLHDGKQALVRARLMKRIRVLGLESFGEYLSLVEEHPESDEFNAFVDVLTTNKTSFFRENQHFEFINQVIIPQMAGRKYKWWSAGCSSGEEPVTMAIILSEAFSGTSNVPVKILATDLSGQMLLKAKHGIYEEEKLADIPGQIRKRYFQYNNTDASYKINQEIRNLISYGRLNLKSSWPLKSQFHLIMCRNVMIYFNRETQKRLVSRFHNQLEPGGYLFLGHSESINAKEQGFHNVRPAVYQKLR